MFFLGFEKRAAKPVEAEAADVARFSRQAAARGIAPGHSRPCPFFRPGGGRFTPLRRQSRTGRRSVLAPGLGAQKGILRLSPRSRRRLVSTAGVPPPKAAAPATRRYARKAGAAWGMPEATAARLFFRPKLVHRPK